MNVEVFVYLALIVLLVQFLISIWTVREYFGLYDHAKHSFKKNSSHGQPKGWKVIVVNVFCLPVSLLVWVSVAVFITLTLCAGAFVVTFKSWWSN